MSKFNAKNLSYEANAPAFLRKLRGEYEGADSVRQDRPLARPRKQVTHGEDDDQPTYVVEGTLDTLSKKEYEDLIRVGENGEGEGVRVGEGQQKKVFEAPAKTEGLPSDAGNAIENGLKFGKEKVASIGGAHKKRSVTAIEVHSEEDDQELQNKRPPKAKKGKKVKLSFDQE